MYLHRQLNRGVIILSACICLYYSFLELHIIVQASWHWQMARPTTCTKLFWNCQPSTYTFHLKKNQFHLKKINYYKKIFCLLYKSISKWIWYVRRMLWHVVPMGFNVFSVSQNSLKMIVRWDGWFYFIKRKRARVFET